MQITIKEIIAPQPPNEEKGWKGTKNYKIVTTDGKNYYVIQIKDLAI